MPWYKIGGHSVHVNMGKRKAPAQCRARDADGNVCRGISAFLCDYPVGNEGKTCDVPLCADHAHVVGADKHYCPMHCKVAEAAVNQLPLFKEGR